MQRLFLRKNDYLISAISLSLILGLSAGFFLHSFTLFLFIEMNPVSSARIRSAIEVRETWPKMTRRNRRSAAKWWWNTCVTPEGVNNWPELWRLINSHAGSIPAELLRR